MTRKTLQKMSSKAFIKASVTAACLAGTISIAGLAVNSNSFAKESKPVIILDFENTVQPVNVSIKEVDTKIVIDSKEKVENNIININYTTGSKYVTLESEKSKNNNQIKLSTEDKQQVKTFETPNKIRCTFYTDYGVTKSGAYTRPGILAGKKEWLGKTCVLYSINPDGTLGNVIGTYEFLDTGAGINGNSIKTGASIDMWFGTYEEGNNFREQYGDYVYMQIL